MLTKRNSTGTKRQGLELGVKLSDGREKVRKRRGRKVGSLIFLEGRWGLAGWYKSMQVFMAAWATYAGTAYTHHTPNCGPSEVQTVDNFL